MKSEKSTNFNKAFQYIIKDELSSKYNYSGVCGKKPFKDLEIAKMMFGNYLFKFTTAVLILEWFFCIFSRCLERAVNWLERICKRINKSIRIGAEQSTKKKQINKPEEAK